jgi:hypothetical protein
MLVFFTIKHSFEKSTGEKTMAQREFTLQVRVSSDDTTVFDTVKMLMIRQCQELYAHCLIAAGNSAQKPDIKLFSDDWIAGQEEIDHEASKVGDYSGGAGSADPDDKVL